MTWKRRVTTFLLLLASAYVALCALLWWQQDGLVFPGAGRGDRGVPATRPAAVVGWIGDGPQRTRIATLSEAAPRAVGLYFGGNGEDLFAAVRSAEELAAYGIECIAVEYPGFGASPGHPGVDSLLATASAALVHGRQRAAALRLPLVVVGSSLGSFCAVHAAAQGGVDKLVLRAPPTSLDAVAKGSYGWLPLGLLLRHRFDNLGKAAAVRCPALVVHGNADTVVPQRFGRELAAAMPQARFVDVPGRGHNDLELLPQGIVGAELRAFLALP